MIPASPNAPKRSLYLPWVLLIIGWSFVGVGVLIAGGVGLVTLGAYFAYRGRRLRTITDLSKLSKDTRQPILYFRPFSSDTEIEPTSLMSESVLKLLIGTSTERLAHQVERVGPFVSIGRPGEKLPPAGPKCLYVSEQWERDIEQLLKNAKFVIFRAGFSWHTVREMHWAAEIVGPGRILFWFPDPRNVNYFEFRQKIGAYLPVVDISDRELVRFVFFDQHWNTTAVQTLGFGSLLGPNFAFWFSLWPFLSRAGVSVGQRRRQITKVIVIRLLVAGYLVLVAANVALSVIGILSPLLSTGSQTK
jgi:hypothetical protein